MEKKNDYNISVLPFRTTARRNFVPQELVSLNNSYRRDINSFDMDEINFDMEMICVRIAADSLMFPSLKKELVEIYQKSPEKYYLCAVRTRGYNASLITAHVLLEEEMEMRRIYSVLITGQQDEDVFQEVRRVLVKFAPELKTLEKKPTHDNLFQIAYKYQGTKQIISKEDIKRKIYRWVGTGLLIAAYVLLQKYTVRELFDMGLRMLTNINVNDRIWAEEADYYLDGKGLKGISNPFDYIDIDTVVWNTVRNIKSYDDASVFEKIFATKVPQFNQKDRPEGMVVVTRDRDAFSGGKVSAKITPLEKTVGRTSILDAVMTFQTETFLANQFGYLPTSMTSTNATITKEDHENILNSLALLTIDMRKNRVLGENEKLKVTFPMYAYALSMYLNMQAIQRNRDFFLKNSRETMFSQTALYQHRAEEAETAADKLKKELAEANERINRLLEQLDQKPSKTTNEKAYLEEIAFLNKTIREQNEVIADWERKGTELNALRELAYLADVDEEPTVEDTDAMRYTLNQMLQTTSVYVIGGHPTWRKRMKAEYPKLNVVDSLANTIDFSGLRDADLVVFNTQHMSHSLGAKVCADLGDSKIPLMFLSRGSNTTKHTKEILMAIERNLGKSA